MASVRVRVRAGAYYFLVTKVGSGPGRGVTFITSEVGQFRRRNPTCQEHNTLGQHSDHPAARLTVTTL